MRIAKSDDWGHNMIVLGKRLTRWADGPRDFRMGSQGLVDLLGDMHAIAVG